MAHYTLTKRGIGDKVNAVKALREATGMGLREGVEVYNQMLNHQAFSTTANLPDTFFVYHYEATAKPAETAKPQSSGLAGAIEAAINEAVGKSVTEDKVKRLIQEALQGVVFPTRVVVERPNLPELDMGTVHKTFPDLVKMTSARKVNGQRVNVWVHGPAGTGKTTAAEALGKVFGVEVTVIPCQDNKFEVTGFVDAQGRVVNTEFVRAYRDGLGIVVDEADAWTPNAWLALNAALANGYVSTPAGMVKRHENTFIVCCANTTGSGSTIEYVGRIKQDRSTMDRFAYLYWPIDEALETSFAVNRDWVRRVQGIRARVNAKGIKVLITPRATIDGDALLATGLEWDKVETMVLKKEMSDSDWNSVK